MPVPPKKTILLISIKSKRASNKRHLKRKQWPISDQECFNIFFEICLIPKLPKFPKYVYESHRSRRIKEYVQQVYSFKMVNFKIIKKAKNKNPLHINIHLIVLCQD